jgi:carbamoyltransferase
VRIAGLGTNCPILFTAHHQAHAASAFYPSPFETAAVVTVDGVGEWATTTIGVGRGSDLRLLKEARFPHSLGLLYTAFTGYCGFRVNSGEYKLMGLAPYGEPRYADVIRRELLDLKPDGSFWLNLDCFSFLHGTTMTNSRFHRLFDGPPRRPEDPVEQRHMDVARSIQVVIEEAMLHWRHARELTAARSVPRRWRGAELRGQWVDPPGRPSTGPIGPPPATPVARSGCARRLARPFRGVRAPQDSIEDCTADAMHGAGAGVRRR